MTLLIHFIISESKCKKKIIKKSVDFGELTGKIKRLNFLDTLYFGSSKAC
jgi:hypothetical protein